MLARMRETTTLKHHRERAKAQRHFERMKTLRVGYQVLKISTEAPSKHPHNIQSKEIPVASTIQSSTSKTYTHMHTHIHTHAPPTDQISSGLLTANSNISTTNNNLRPEDSRDTAGDGENAEFGVAPSCLTSSPEKRRPSKYRISSSITHKHMNTIVCGKNWLVPRISLGRKMTALRKKIEKMRERGNESTHRHKVCVFKVSFYLLPPSFSISLVFYPLLYIRTLASSFPVYILSCSFPVTLNCKGDGTIRRPKSRIGQLSRRLGLQRRRLRLTGGQTWGCRRRGVCGCTGW